MTNSLRAKLSKLRHVRNITEEEYKILINKLDGHDKQIREKTIDECINAIAFCVSASECDEILNRLKEKNKC